MSDLFAALYQSMGGKVEMRWADTLTDNVRAEERKQNEAEQVAQALRDSFYGKGENEK